MRSWEEVIEDFKKIIGTDSTWRMRYENDSSICAESSRHTVRLSCVYTDNQPKREQPKYFLLLECYDHKSTIDSVDDVAEIVASAEVLRPIFEFIESIPDGRVTQAAVPNDTEKLILNRMAYGAEIVVSERGFELRELDRFDYPLTDAIVQRLRSADLIKEETRRTADYLIVKKFVLA